MFGWRPENESKEEITKRSQGGEKLKRLPRIETSETARLRGLRTGRICFLQRFQHSRRNTTRGNVSEGPPVQPKVARLCLQKLVPSEHTERWIKRTLHAQPNNGDLRQGVHSYCTELILQSPCGQKMRVLRRRPSEGLLLSTR